MNSRKPNFMSFGTLGACIAYPVTICVGRRQYEDKVILVSLKRWNEGQRKFGYFDCMGVGAPEYVPTPKVERGIERAINTYLQYVQKRCEIRKLKDELSKAEEELDAIMDGYTTSLR
jgi:hypothetical protein